MSDDPQASRSDQSAGDAMTLGHVGPIVIWFLPLAATTVLLWTLCEIENVLYPNGSWERPGYEGAPLRYAIAALFLLEFPLMLGIILLGSWKLSSRRREASSDDR